jgi:hypothetical protein
MSLPAVSAGEFVKLATSQVNTLQRALKAVEEAERQHREQMGKLQEARDRALDELVSLSLPALTREAFAAVPSLTGYRQFERNDPFERMERRRQELSARVVAIEADEKYRRREQLLNPAAGDLTLKRDELENRLKLMDETLAQYEGEPEFLGLVERGYGTDRYSLTWADLQYYSDWKYGDLITEKFGQQSFGDVLHGYQQVKAGREVFYQDVQRVRGQIAEIEALVTERQASLSALENIEAETLKGCWQQLREHLEYIDRNELAALFPTDLNRAGLLKRIHGIEKKMEYLDELAGRYLTPERQQLLAMINKLDRKVAKYSRPKNRGARIPVAEANQMLRDPTAKLASRRRRFDESYHQIVYFERYDAFDYARDMLWWDVMTDGRLDGDFIPEVQAWREQHPRLPPTTYDAGVAGTPYASPLVGSSDAGSFTDVS